MDPLEWFARLADHIPDPGRHRTHFYAHYANRVRGERPGEGEPRHTGEAEPPPRRRCSSTWALLIAKVFQADPLVCQRCGGPLRVVALHNRRAGDPADLGTPRPQPPPKSRLLKSAMSSACRWTTRGARSTSNQPELSRATPGLAPRRAWCLCRPKPPRQPPPRASNRRCLSSGEHPPSRRGRVGAASKPFPRPLPPPKAADSTIYRSLRDAPRPEPLGNPYESPEPSMVRVRIVELRSGRVFGACACARDGCLILLTSTR